MVILKSQSQVNSFVKRAEEKLPPFVLFAPWGESIVVKNNKVIETAWYNEDIHNEDGRYVYTKRHTREKILAIIRIRVK